MNQTLRPFQDSGAPQVRIQASATTLNHKTLLLQFEITGNIDGIRWPIAETKPGHSLRKDSLWKHTCFEAFVQPEGTTAYWEANLAPSGEWNLYRFSDYRKGMTTEERVDTLGSDFKKSGDRAILSCRIDLETLCLKGGLRVGLTAVIETVDGNLSYWAITHAGNEADFHLAESFSLSVRSPLPKS